MPRHAYRLSPSTSIAHLLAPIAIFSLSLIVACNSSTSTNGDGGTGSDAPLFGGCPGGIDPSIDISTAVSLDPGTEVSGYICPRTDKDYYKVEVPTGQGLLKIDLQHGAPITPIGLDYLILRSADDVADRAPAGQNNRFDALHCLAPGTYYLQVQDQGNDAFDDKNAYRLSYTTAADPDTNEPNDSKETAVTAQASNQGYISCTGDVDYFKLTAEAGDLLNIKLSNEQATAVDLKYTIYRAVGDQLEIVATDAAPNGTLGATELKTVRAVPGAGTYYIAVEDAAGDDSDVNTAYTLELSSVKEPDVNEGDNRNDRPETATPLLNYSASGGCVTTEKQGRIASVADVDYFRISDTTPDTDAPVSSTNPGVVQIELSFDRATGIDPSIALIYPHADTSCTSDKCCQVLNSNSCSDPLSCGDSSFICVSRGTTFCSDAACITDPPLTCASDRRCAGAATCLPQGVCGAQQFFRNRSDGAPLREAQPLIHAGPWYVRVSDDASDETDLDAVYTLKVTVCPDPDGSREMDNFYFPRMRRQATDDPIVTAENTDPITLKTKFQQGGKPTTPADFSIPSGDNQGDWSPWIEGYIAYENDQDFFEFDNPCPGADCMLEGEFRAVAGSGEACPAGDDGAGLEFQFFLQKDIFGLGDLIEDLPAGTPAGQTQTVTHTYEAPSGKCEILINQNTTAKLKLVVTDKYSNNWSLTCKYGARFRISLLGCPEPPCKLVHDVLKNADVCSYPY